MLAAALLALLGALGGSPALAQDTTRAELVFLDVGQGDAIVVRSPEGKTALIDAGPQSIVPQLRTLGIDTIALAIASHPHADHIGGMEAVLRAFPVRYYMDNGVPHTTATYRSLMRWVERSGVTYLQATARTVTLGSVTLRILPPLRVASNLNDQSVGVIVQFGSFRAILPGDAQWDALQYFATLGVPQVTVLKAAHHGSDNGVTPAWLAATRPKLVVISCGAGNTYGHPHPHALRLYQAAATVYRTDLDGQITIHAARDGSAEVTTERSARSHGGRPRAY